MNLYAESAESQLLIVPRQSGGIYSGNVARIKTVNPQRDIVIRRLFNRDSKNNKAIKLKEMMNSSNYILVTYLSDIESKFILCHFCMVLANLSF